ncbi:MAG: ABC transporter permease [Nanoarchaeota archaeon]|nr:ABC transporter permease [Nanoarchaeota archaeon]
MKNIFRIISKNLKLLIRAKSSAIIVILAPLLIILLVGIAFDNANTYGLNIGVYSSDFNQNVESFLNKLSQKEFNIIKYQEEEKCVNDIKLGSTHTCVVFPPNLDFNSNQQQTITFYIDQSKINLVWMIMDTLSSGITERSKEISKDLTNIVLSKLEKTKTNLGENKPILINVKTENNNVLIKAQEIGSQITSLNFDVDSFGAATTQTSLLAIQGNLSSDIELAKSMIKSARSAVGGSSASESEVEDIKEKLNNALEKLDEAKTNIEDNSTKNNQSLTNIATQIQNIQTKLNSTKNQISSAVSSSQQKLNEMQGSLSQSVTDLGTIETMMDSLLTDIQSIKVTDAAAIASPVVTDIKPISAEKTYLNYLFPSLMILVVMFISILLGTTLVMMEKHSPALFRNFITPTRNITFIISTYLTNIFLILIQMVIILGIALYFFSGQILPSLPMVILILLIAATLFSFVGMGVGYLFRSEETSTLAAISFGSLCLFMSSTIIPLESMPTTIRQIAFYNPFVVAERLLRSVILFQPKIKFLANDIFILLGYALVLFLFIWGSQSLASKHLFQKMSYKRHKKKKKAKETETKNIAAKKNPIPIPPPEAKPKSRPKIIPSRTVKAGTKILSKPIKRPAQESDIQNELDRINSELAKLQ